MEGGRRSWKPWKSMECVRMCWKTRKVMKALRSSKSFRKSVELYITVECSSKADLIEIKCRTKDPYRDQSMTSGIRAKLIRGDGKRRDTVASLAKRVVGVETSMSELKERVEESHQHLEELGSNFTELREDFKSALNILGGNLGREIHDLRGMLIGEIKRIRGEVEEEWRSLRRELKVLRADVSLCKRFMASGGGNTSNITPKVEVLKPSPFMGKRKARAVDDFVWEIEQCMKGVNIVDDALKIKMATGYLKDTAALWWRRQYGDIERVTCTINTWVDFVQDLKKQFYRENAKHEVKSRLCKLKHYGTIREYVKEFTFLVLEIPDLSDQDSLFYFLDGLQGWAKTELERRGVQDLATAIAHAKALIDLIEWRSRKPTNEDSGDKQGGGEKQVKDRDDGTGRPPQKVKTSYKSIKYFVCDGPHKGRDCPKTMSFQAMTAETREVPCVTPPKINNAADIPLGVLLHSSYTQVTEKDLKRDV
ncbi:putative retrotransposon gag domain, aspartic peptidase domain protein [Tanacetum coccineum]